MKIYSSLKSTNIDLQNKFVKFLGQCIKDLVDENREGLNDGTIDPDELYDQLYDDFKDLLDSFDNIFDITVGNVVDSLQYDKNLDIDEVL